MAKMHLLDLPNKLLLLITEHLPSRRFGFQFSSVNAFAQVNRRLYHLVNPGLYALDLEWGHFHSSHSHAMCWAIWKRREGTLQKSLHTGANWPPAAFAHLCRVPVHEAAKRRNETLMKLLLDAVRVVDPDKDWSPLPKAAETGHEGVVRLLLDWPGVNVNAKDAYDCTALMKAVEGGHENIVKLLLARPDLDVNARNEDGMTALALAVDGVHEEIVKLLLARHDIDVIIRDSIGETPLEAAMGDDLYEIAMFLEEKVGVFVYW